LWHATGTVFRAAGMLLQGELKESLPLLLKGAAAFRATGARLTVPFQLGILGEAYTQAGRFADAGKALDEALALVEETDERWQEADLYRLRGELLLATPPGSPPSEGGDPGGVVAAEGCFRQAIDTARRQGSRAWELRATMSLARLGQRQGR